MPHRLYRLLERHQRLDELLRLALRRDRADPIEIVRLRFLKLRLRSRLALLTRQHALAS